MAEIQLLSRENNIARLRVELDSKEVDSAFAAAYKQIGRNMMVPGFRKGKVPPNIIRQRVGAEAITEEVAANLKEYAINKALSETKLTPRSGRTVWHLEGSPVSGEPIAYELSQPVLPEVELPDFASISINVTRLPITDEMKQRFTDRLVDRFSESVPREGPSQDGDVLTIGIHSHFADTGEEADFGGHDIRFSLGLEGNLPGWDEQLRGAAAGEHRSFEYEMPKDYSDENIAGKTLRLDIHIDGVEQVNRAAFDEAFVQEKLQLDTMEKYEDYRQSILEREVESQLRQHVRDETAKRLSEGVKAEVSEDMVSDEIDGMLKEHDRMLRQYGTSLDAYLKDKEMGLPEYRETLKESATGKIRFFLAVNEIAARQDIHATNQDLNRYAYYLMQQEGLSPDQIKELLREPGFVNEAAYQIVRDKVIEYVLNNISVSIDGVVRGPADAGADEAAADIEAAGADAAPDSAEVPAEASDDSPAEADADAAENQ